MNKAEKSQALHDRSGLELSTPSEAAADHYNRGVELLLAGRGGAESEFSKSLEADPLFALGQIGMALTLADSGRAIEAQKAAQTAFALLTAHSRTLKERERSHTERERSHTERERSHIEVVYRFLCSDKKSAASELAEHLKIHPSDSLILEELTRYWFFYGGVGKRKRVADLIKSVASSYSDDDWFFAGRAAFHYQEVNELDLAESLAEKSLRLNPQNTNAIHTLAHIYHLRSEIDKGERISEWLKTYEPTGRLYEHLAWHVALLKLERGQLGAAGEFYHARSHVRSKHGPKYLTLADGAGFQWRRLLHSEKPVLDERTEPLLKLAREMTSKPGTPFIDIQAAFVFALFNESDLSNLRKALCQHPENTSTEFQNLIRVIDGLAAFVQNDFNKTVDLFEPLMREQFESLGGSNLERSLLEFTYFEASLRADRTEVAMAILGPALQISNSPHAHFLMGRLLKAEGREEESISHLRTARSLYVSNQSDSPELKYLDKILRNSN